MEKVKNKIYQFYKEYKTVFFVTLVMGIITHLYILTNKLVNHDDINCLFAKGATYEMGRWGLEIIKYIFPNMSMPVFNGIIAIILISVSACFIVKILDIKSKLKQCLVGVIMIVYPSIICAFAYMFTINSYAVAILLATLSVYFAMKKGKANITFSILCLVFSLGIYQAYFSITVALFIVLLIKDCINEEKNFKQIMLKGIKFLLILFVSLAIYMIITTITCKITGVNLGEYQGAGNLGNISFVSIIKGIARAERTVLQMAFGNFYGISTGIILKILNTAILLINVIYAILHIKQIAKKDLKKALLFIVLGIILPIAMNTMYIINENTEFHTLIMYANFIMTILPLILMEGLQEKIVKYLDVTVCIVLAVIAFRYVTLANECYLKMQLTFDNAYSFYTTLVTRIESTEGFNENTRIAIIGNYTGEKETNTDEQFEELEHFIGVVTNKQLINAYSKTNFIKYYIGVDFEYVSQNELEELSNSEEVKSMSIYPYENSIKNINNIIVVKLSE